MTVPIIAIVIAGASLAITMAGLAITVIVLLVRGGFLLGQLVQQVENLEEEVESHDAKIDALETKMDAKFDAMDAKMDARFDAMDAKMDARFDALNARMDALTAAVQQNYAILMAMANHTHDSDGRVVFTVIPGDR